MLEDKQDDESKAKAAEADLERSLTGIGKLRPVQEKPEDVQVGSTDGQTNDDKQSDD